MKTKIILTLVLTLSGCASTAVTQVSKNQFMLSTSAAPACGSSGAQKVAGKMAAVETLRRGYSHFLITGAQRQNNVQAISTGPTGAYTTGQINSYGNTAYGSANTTFTGGGVLFTGSHDANLMVVMLKKGDPGYSNGVNARQTLGADWEKIVKSGVNSCAD